MENFEVKKYLRRPTRLYGDIVVLQEKIENLRIKMLPRAMNFEKERVQTSPEDPMPNFAAELDELDRQMAKLMNEYYESMGEVEKTISKVEDEDARVVLAKRYVGLKSWRVIEDETAWTRQTLWRKHGTGLRAVEIILKNS